MKSPIIFRIFKNDQIQFVKQFVDKDQIIIGQAATDADQVDIQLDSKDISAIHCLVEKRGSDYYICDLGSVSGTFKNNVKIIDDKIGPGDEITVGPFKIIFLTMPSTVAATETVAAVKSEPVVKPAVVVTSALNKPSIQETIAVQRPVQKGIINYKAKRKKGTKTFSPANAHTNLNEFIRTGKGDIIQVITSWKGRVLDTKSFLASGTYKAGSAEAIQLPEGTVTSNVVLIDQLNVLIPAAAKAQVKRGNELNNISEKYKLAQDEVVYLNFTTGIELAIRFVPNSKNVVMESPIILTSSELTGILFALIIAALTSLIVSVFTPKDIKQDEDIQRVAQVIFNKPPPVVVPPVIKTPEQKPDVVKEVEKKPVEKKEVKAAKISEEQKNKGDVTKPDAKAQQAEKAGRAAEVKPKDPKLKTKMFTSTKQGGAIKTGEKAGANAQSKEKDPTNSGLLAAFGSGGARSKLDKAYNGSGELLGAGEKATGTSGFNENRAGDDLGSKFKDTGAGGKGTATQGIAGVGTKGRGNGMSGYGSGDGFGSKDQVAIQAGGAEEDFVGSIDREAVRRAVKSAMSAFKACYERELKKDSKLEGKVVISWEIHEKGVGKNSKVVKDKSTIGNSSVEECVRERILAIRYPEPPAGTVAEVTFPFLFSGQK